MSTRYDVAIIGSGPAGISAAINAKVRNKSVVVFGDKDLSNKIVKAPEIKNYLGLPKVTGKQLKENFNKHIEEMGIEINTEKISTVYAMGDYFALKANENFYEATAVIVATGVEMAKPLPGESEFLGNGVGYCATCDAHLYKGKTAAVVGYNEEAVEEANYISEIADKVYFVPMFDGEHNLNSNIDIVESKPVAIQGNGKVERLVLNDREIQIDGIFILKDSVGLEQLVPGLEMDDMHIKVNRNLETNLEGLFAAGDITGKPYQYLKSAGEGQVAALNAVSYVDKLKKS